MPSDSTRTTTAADAAPRPAEPGAYGVRPPGYRLPEAAHVGGVRLQVADLARSLAYYRTVLGFRVIAQGAGRATLGVGCPPTGGCDARPLVELHERPGATPVPRRGRLGLYHFAILLPDRPSLGRFLAHLGQLGVYAGMSDHFVSEALYLTDPDGLGIEVYADRPRGAWMQRGRELAMATEPLDAADVVRAGGGEPWAGMPAGTTIGHVHLYVGDLEQAAAFYHAALGLDAVVWSYPGALFLSAGGYHHHLGVNTWATGAARATDADARLLEWELVLPTPADASAASRSLREAGHDLTDEPSPLATDPWGTRVRLVAAG